MTTLSNLVRFTTQKSQQNDKTLNSKKQKTKAGTLDFFLQVFTRTNIVTNKQNKF